MKIVWESFDIGRIFQYPRNISLSVPIFKYHFRRMDIVSSDIKIKKSRRVSQQILTHFYMIIKNKLLIYVFKHK